MCGIAGWIANSASFLAEDAIEPMLDALAHRGPDGRGRCAFQGRSSGEQVMLGHRRLAIIDPAGARQPMCDDAQGIALTFNGEIYNFRELRQALACAGYTFARDSDTEVLLRAYQHWGTDVVSRLRGQFAFAIWDAPRERLFLARDRFGEKPLYLYEDARGLFFASEVKALLRVPGIAPGVDPTAVWDYLAYRYVPGPKTLFAGVRKLLPGCYALWKQGRLTERRYWTPPDRAPRGETQHGANAVSAFRGRLEEAVRLQMVSDVPFGAFLSGGIDSTTIVALMRRHSDQVKTFSVGFDDERYSELRYAAEAARHLGTVHHELVVAHHDVIERLPALVGYRDAPVSEPSDVAIHMLACEASRSVKMVLTGEGSDELLGGYPKHIAEQFAPRYQRLPGLLRHRLVGPLAQALPYRFRRVKTAITNLGIEDWRERYVRWFGALSRSERDRLSVLQANGSTYHAAGPPFDQEPGNSALRGLLYFDQTSWLPDNLLERGDRMTMAASIEARVPFLDHKLAEFVSSLPDRFRVRGLTSKWILRAAAGEMIPRRILNRKKVGFRVPVNEWFRRELRGFLGEHLQGGGSLTRCYYEPAALDAVIADHTEGRQNHEKLLWSLLNLEIWHRHYARG